MSNKLQLHKPTANLTLYHNTTSFYRFRLLSRHVCNLQLHNTSVAVFNQEVCV